MHPRDHCERKIIAIAAFVIGSEPVAADCDCPAIAKIAEGADDWRCRCVIDDRKHGADGNRTAHTANCPKQRACVYRYSRGHHFVSAQRLGFQLPVITPVCSKGEHVLDCEKARRINAGIQDRAIRSTGSNCHRSSNATIAAELSIHYLHSTAAGPGATRVVTLSVPPLTTAPPT
jgi:hypothetical protein